MRTARGALAGGVGMVIAFGLLTTACGDPTADTNGSSGIEGTTTVDGGCPLVRPDSPCPDKPIAATITVSRSGSDDVVQRVRTDDQGHFRIPLEPGTYLVTPTNTRNALLPRAAKQTVTVPADTVVQLAIRFDSGIRSPTTDSATGG